jgi:pimeloyl-ACP methyl ester carboxylesterase
MLQTYRLYVNSALGANRKEPPVTTRTSVELPQGTIRYRDEGEGEPILFVHGALVNGDLWSRVTPRLVGDMRCVVPDLPLGSHPVAMEPTADLSPPGLARLIDDFAEAVGLGPVTLVGNDTGGALCQLVATNHPDRVRRLILTNCDLYDRFPPPPFHLFKLAPRIPGGVWAMGQPFRSRVLTRRLVAMLAHEPVPDEILDSWVHPSLHDAGVRRDIGKLLTGISPTYTLEAAERLRGFDRPALLVWGLDDPYFKLSYAERLAGDIPGCRLERVEGSRTFVQWDRPERLGELIAGFVRETTAAEAA